MRIVKSKIKLANDKHLAMLDEINERGKQLEPWEFSFVVSLIELKDSSPQLSLTKPQMIKIANIHKRRVI